VQPGPRLSLSLLPSSSESCHAISPTLPLAAPHPTARSTPTFPVCSQACIDVVGGSAGADVEAADPFFDVSQDLWTVEAIDVVEHHVRMWRFERLDWGI
jgi:hypothetical protein